MERDPENVQKQIERRISELPEDIQNAIFASDLNEKIQAIASANQLHIDQAQELADNTMLLMIGFMTEQDFHNELGQIVGSNSNAVQKITSEINNGVLLPIRESMKKFAAGQGSSQVSPAAAVTETGIPPMGSKPPLAAVLPKGPVAAPATPMSVPMQTMPTSAPSSMNASPAVPPVAPSMPPVPAISKTDMHPADVMLTQKTVSLPQNAPVPAAPLAPKPPEAKAVPPKPTDYKADPYREPIS